MNRPRVDIDFSDSSVLADPFPAYEAVRFAGRIVWNGTAKAWMVTGFDDCVEILGDARVDRFRQVDDPDVIFWFDAPNMITVDGADHHRLRGCLVPYFTRRVVSRWEGRVREVVDELLLPLAEGREFNLRDFTVIPTVIVAEMLGVPKERHEDFRRWSNLVTNNVAYGHGDRATRQRMLDAVAELNSYLAEEMERHRQGEFDDLLSAMLTMPALSDAELRWSAVNLLLAGYGTTAKLMSMCLVALPGHPEQRRAVAEDLSLVPGAIEEVLRWVGVSQILARAVVRDIEFAGAKLAAGDTVYVVLASANRDPARWVNPARFDVHREPKTHVGFGFGPHLCIGAPLARLETKVALERLPTLAPDYRLRDVAHAGSIGLRGPDRGFLDVLVHSA